MAREIKMENPRTGRALTAFHGFSWTTLFFGPLPALFRLDMNTFVGQVIVTFLIIFPKGYLHIQESAFVLFIYWATWAFLYNKYYTNNLIKDGFILVGSSKELNEVASELGLILNENNSKISSDRPTEISIPPLENSTAESVFIDNNKENNPDETPLDILKAMLFKK